jgi:hypothetical protein
MSCPNCAPRNKSAKRTATRTAGTILPGIVLALMPKCPACIVAYAAIFTGLGISLTAATYLWTGAIVLCVASILAVAAMTVFSWISSKRCVQGHSKD